MNENAITHTGEVRALLPGRLLVGLQLDGCASCGHGKACGMARMKPTGAAADTVLELSATPAVLAAVKPGDRIMLRISERDATTCTLAAYLWPTLALLFGAGLGQQAGDAGAALGAAVGFIVGMLGLRFLSRPGRLPAPEIVPLSSASSSSPSGASS